MNISKISSVSLVTASLMLACTASLADSKQVHVVTPNSSIEHPENVGRQVHTSFVVLQQSAGQISVDSTIKSNPPTIMAPNTQVKPSAIALTQNPSAITAPFTGLGYQTPSSIACIYNLIPSANLVPGCNPDVASTPVVGNIAGAKVIAIVDAYHYPNAKHDLTIFSNYFGLPTPELSVVYASGSQPSTDPQGWEVEAALDLQWAHAMAPAAKLILVEAASNDVMDMLAAVQVATEKVQAAGGGAVSMSWGGSEFEEETSLENYFNNSGVVYFASSGDSSGTLWPCVSQNVVCVGGTTLRVHNGTDNPTSMPAPAGNFIQEVAWIDGGGGLSPYVSAPQYQTGKVRKVPDVALAADPLAGGYVVYKPSDDIHTYWYVVGGTSWSSPMAAGITANATGGIVPTSTSLAELTKIYNGTYKNSFKDITLGWCGAFSGLNSSANWDFCTGVGSYKGYK